MYAVNTDHQLKFELPMTINGSDTMQGKNDMSFLDLNKYDEF